MHERDDADACWWWTTSAFFREAIREALREAGFACALRRERGRGAATLADDRASARSCSTCRCPGTDGLEVLRRLRERRPALRVIVLSAAHGPGATCWRRCAAAPATTSRSRSTRRSCVLAVRRALEAPRADGARLRRAARAAAARWAAAWRRSRGAARGRERAPEARSPATIVAGARPRCSARGRPRCCCSTRRARALRVAAAIGARARARRAGRRCRSGEGVAGRAFASGEADRWWPTSSADPRFAGRARRERYRSSSFAVAPLPARRGRARRAVRHRPRAGAPFGEEDARAAAHPRAPGRRSCCAPARARRPPAAAAPRGGAALARPASRPDAARTPSSRARVCDALAVEVEPERLLDAALRPVAARARGARRCRSTCSTRAAARCASKASATRRARAIGRACRASAASRARCSQTGRLVATRRARQAEPRFDRRRRHAGGRRRRAASVRAAPLPRQACSASCASSAPSRRAGRRRAPARCSAPRSPQRSATCSCTVACSNRSRTWRARAARRARASPDERMRCRPDRQGRGADRGAAVHPALLRQDHRDQVRRQRADGRGAARVVRASTSCCSSTSACAR